MPSIEMSIAETAFMGISVTFRPRMDIINRMRFHELYEQHAPDVYRFVYWLSGNEADAEDITSETFVRAWAGRDKIRTETIKAYLFTIARNLFLKQQRLARRQSPLRADHVDGTPSLETQITLRAEIEMVHEVLQQMPEINRAAFILRIQYELPYTEIARILGLSLSATKVMVHRARLRLALARSAESEI
jgi:RNA polymerase sigma factor (sigma-70 family)